MQQKLFGRLFTALILLVLVVNQAFAGDLLPSWNDGKNKKALTTFVNKVTTPDTPDFVAEPERIAVFDNDGTLWAEQPLYFQAIYIFDRVRELALQHPEWKDSEPFASVLKGDLQSALAGGKEALLELTMATHSGLTAAEFSASSKNWLETARHPESGMRYAQMVYQPMLEVLDYLRANGFKTYIVSGGGIDFVRAFSEEVYGIPPEQVVGSSLGARYEMRDGEPVIVKLPELDFIDDKAGKPVGIHRHIGRRPILAFGNSDGDFEMLEYTTTGAGLRLGLLLHHDDAEREWAYDRDSHIGRLARGLDESPQRGWKIVSMKNDWKRVYPETE